MSSLSLELTNSDSFFAVIWVVPVQQDNVLGRRCGVNLVAYARLIEGRKTRRIL